MFTLERATSTTHSFEVCTLGLVNTNELLTMEDDDLHYISTCGFKYNAFPLSNPEKSPPYWECCDLGLLLVCHDGYINRRSLNISRRIPVNLLMFNTHGKDKEALKQLGYDLRDMQYCDNGVRLFRKKLT